MTRTLDASQTVLSGRATLIPLNLICLTTYSDRQQKIVQERIYLSDRRVIYDYSNTGTDQTFLPILGADGDAGISPIRASITHVPAAGATELLRKPVTVTLDNAEIAGARVSARLRGLQIEGADIEISQLLLPKLDSHTVDLSAYTGDEHTVLYRGEVHRMAPVTESSVTLRCRLRMPSVEWLSSQLTPTPAQWRGVRFPIVYGNAEKVRLIPYRVQSYGVLETAVTSSTTGVWDVRPFHDSGYFLSSVGAAIEQELMTMAALATINNVDVSIRGVQSTTAAAHGAGSILFGLTALNNNYLLANAYGSNALNGLFTQPTPGMLVEVLSADYTKKVAVAGDYYFANASQSNFSATREFSWYEMDQTDMIDHYKRTMTADDGRERGEWRFFADVDGIEAPVIDGFDPGYSFDAGTWSDSPYTSSSETTKKSEGTGSRQYDIDFDDDTVMGVETNSITNWTEDLNCTIATTSYPADLITDDVVTVIADASGTARGSYYNAAGIADLTDTGSGPALVVFDLDLFATYIPPPSGPSYAYAGGITVRIGSSNGSNYNEYAAVVYHTPPVPGPPYTIVIDYNQTPDATNGTFDPANWNYIAFEFEGSDVYSYGFKIHDIRTLRNPEHVIQNNAVGGLDLTTISGYRLYLMTEGIGQVFLGGFTFGTNRDHLQITVELSTTTGTGTAQETDRHDVVFAETKMSLSYRRPHENTVFSALDSVTNDDAGAGPTITNINTLRVVMAISLHGVFNYYTPNKRSIYLDRLEVASAETNPYDASSGALLTTPTDILRHWISVIGGETVDETSFTASSTNLSGLALAGDVRVLGPDWESIAAALAYSCRSNLIPTETSSGRSWRLLQADSSYDFPAATATIDEWDTIVEGGRDTEELATRFRVQYKYDATLGQPPSSEGGYAETLIVNVDKNDVSAAVATDDLTAAEQMFGRIDAQPILLPAVIDSTTAVDVAGYYVRESLRIAPLFAVSGVPWWQAYAIEVGDVVSIRPPWESDERKCRVIEYVKDFETEQVELRLVEVP